MSRSRNIKPGFFLNADLVELDPLTRLLFIGLWTAADREGRLEDRPKYIKLQLLPADNCDVNTMLESLHASGFIIRYQAEEKKYIQVVNFKKHQSPHIKEPVSTIPAPDQHQTKTGQAALIPDSGFLIPDSGFPPPDESDTSVETDRMTTGELRQEFEQRTGRRINNAGEITILQDFVKSFTRTALIAGLESTCSGSPDKPFPYFVTVMRNSRASPEPDYDAIAAELRAQEAANEH